MAVGLVSLVGAGPGDPGLLTLAGRDRLAAADVVVYDRLVSPALLEHCRADAEVIFAGKSPAGHTLTQDAINELLVKEGRAGKRVVRLKGGDPFVFGRGGEEAIALASAGVAFEVIPGVTSAVAAPAYAGVPVTHRGIASSFAVITGHEDDAKEESAVDWAKLATAVDTLVILMGAAALPTISKALIAGGRSPETPAVSVYWGSTPEQRSIAAPLASIADTVREAGLGTPLLTVVGDVAGLREHMSWFESRPLFGKRILVTRTRQQASAISDLLRREGAVPVELPSLEMVPSADEEGARKAVEKLLFGLYFLCVFTSANAVDHFWRSLLSRGLDARVFGDCRIAAIGGATAEALLQRGLKADIIAGRSTSEGLLAELSGWDVDGELVLIPRAGEATDVLPGGLRERGAQVDELILYESRPPAEVDPEALDLIRKGMLDAATFASSSSVRNLASLLGADFERLKRVVIACIGGVTAETAREYGLQVAVESPEQRVEALVEALRDHYARG
jgi:uroporphyrinogen III methyltransferase / synthase